MSDRSDLMEVALHLQECKRLLLAERFGVLLIILDKMTDLVARFQDELILDKMTDLVDQFQDEDIIAVV